MKHNRQAGGTATFIIIGVVLAALFGGALFASKQQGRVASTAPSSTVASEKAPAAQTPKSEPATTQPAAAPTPPAASPQPSASATTPAPTPVATNVPSTGPTNIAATGPADVAIQMTALSLLVAGFLAMIRSFRTVRTRALQHTL